MKTKFFLKLFAIFAVPIIYFSVFIFLEPFNYFGIYKKPYDYNNVVARAKAFRRNKNDNIVLGASRFVHFAAKDEITEITTDEKFDNLAFGGASLYEEIDLFWWATQRHKLKKVIFGLSFWTINSAYESDRMQRTFPFIDNPFRYMLSFSYNQYYLNSIKNRIDPPAILEVSNETRRSYALDTVYPFTEIFLVKEDDIASLKEIADFCDDNDIELCFVIPPVHTSIYEYVLSPLDMYDKLDSYKAALSHLAPVYDMEYLQNYYTTSTDFRDGFHLDPESETFAEYKKSVFLPNHPHTRLWLNGKIVE